VEKLGSVYNFLDEKLNEYHDEILSLDLQIEYYM